jgi:uncharacterized cupin superfamily protein
MKLNIQEVPAEKVTGREIRNMVNGQVLGSQDMTLQIVDVLPGTVSKPGHSHTNCEEIIYSERRWFCFPYCRWLSLI